MSFVDFEKHYIIILVVPRFFSFAFLFLAHLPILFNKLHIVLFKVLKNVKPLSTVPIFIGNLYIIIGVLTFQEINFFF